MAVRAIIDVSGLREAADYYGMFPREPAKVRQNDMTITNIVRVSDITFEKVLDQMIVAGANNEPVVLVVAHGDQNGFLMPIAQPVANRHVSASKDALRIVMGAATAMDRRQRIGQQATGQIEAWRAFINSLRPGSVVGDITVDEANAWFNNWLDQQAGGLALNANGLVSLTQKMNQVRQIRFNRVEIRACNIGADMDAMYALKEFLGSDSVCAPNVGTFYVSVIPFVTSNERRLTGWARRFAGPAGGPLYGGAGQGPRARHFDVIVPAPHDIPMGFVILEGFALRVREISLRPHLYAARASASSWSHVKHWVDQNIFPGSTYRRGQFYLAGMWTFAQSTEPYATPMDPAYRNVIVCVT